MYTPEMIESKDAANENRTLEFPFLNGFSSMSYATQVERETRVQKYRPSFCPDSEIDSYFIPNFGASVFSFVK